MVLVRLSSSRKHILSSGSASFFSNICGHVYAENIGDHDDKEPFYDDNMGYFWDNSMMIIWDIYVIIL